MSYSHNSQFLYWNFLSKWRNEPFEHLNLWNIKISLGRFFFCVLVFVVMFCLSLSHQLNWGLERKPAASIENWGLIPSYRFPSLTSVPRSWCSPLASEGTRHAHDAQTYRQNTHTHKVNFFKIMLSSFWCFETLVSTFKIMEFQKLSFDFIVQTPFLCNYCLWGWEG